MEPWLLPAGSVVISALAVALSLNARRETRIKEIAIAAAREVFVSKEVYERDRNQSSGDVQEIKDTLRSIFRKLDENGTLTTTLTTKIDILMRREDRGPGEHRERHG